MRQVEHESAEAPVLIVTHRTERAALDGALAAIAEARRLPGGAGGDPDRGGLSRCAARRRPRPADVPAIQAIYAHHVLTGLASFEEVPPDPAEMARRRADVTGRGLPHLVAEVEGRVVGYAYAGPYRARVAYRFTVEDFDLRRAGGDRRGSGAGCWRP